LDNNVFDVVGARCNHENSHVRV